MARPAPVKIPLSYASLRLEHIALSHVPASSSTATAVVVLRLNRPEKNNAWTEVMMREIETVYQLFDLDERVKAIVFTGAGKMFCAGYDMEIGFPGGDASKFPTRKAAKPGKEKDNEHRDSYASQRTRSVRAALTSYHTEEGVPA
jgi:enoyl-CoA hydratase/carnithine racemase